ncbi:hypothetical protein [Streptomyces yaizuensis]|uniref:Uncharacterized protein n=1 Tax=Streptomyces yaizuensis TaxID=2989713 RepID=A0ABQ5NY82_9ACTN|nr:hypothetical protein [Streptomyces sp. YSPA8]GLF95329.1 hypothetical protein SYYSPA8_13550 [Streptomyces sp. YSPA8]
MADEQVGEATGSPKERAPAPAPSGSVDSRAGALPEGVGSGARCRGDWQAFGGAGVEVKPCIERRTSGVVVSARVRAADPASAPVGATVWVWLMKADPDLVAQDRPAMTRDESTAHRCPISFRDDGSSVEECSRQFTPQERGVYTTAVDVGLSDSEFSPKWANRTFWGTQSVWKVTWPPT